MSHESLPSIGSLSEPLARRLERVCTDFEDAWRSGQRPRMEERLEGLGEHERAVFLRELLTLELAYRAQNGERAGLEEYRERFPEHGALLAEVFSMAESVQESVDTASYAGGSQESGSFRDQDLAAPPDVLPPTATDLPDRRSTQPKHEPHWLAAKQVGKYRIADVLGSGGQAITYKAFDPDLARHVVLKLYHAARTPAQQETVLKEGQALARVRSPYVAQCHGVERHEGVPYLVIEYIPGRNLAELHKARPLNVAQSLELTARVAEGLAAVHACGLLHRDLKPANILVGDDGLPRLVDFGLVKPLGDDTLHHISGTLAYMPPEQARGESDRIDARTDLFGLGAVLYHLLTGGPPYHGLDRDDLWEAARIGDVAPARERNPKLAVAVNDLCMRCLAKDPTGRFTSAAELAQTIRGMQGRRRWRPWLAAAALLALIGVVLRFGPWHGSPSESPTPAVQTPSMDDVPRDPDGKALQQDFPLSVKLVGSRKDPAGPLHHITDGQLLSFVIESPQNCYVGV